MLIGWKASGVFLTSTHRFFFLPPTFFLGHFWTDSKWFFWKTAHANRRLACDSNYPKVCWCCCCSLVLLGERDTTAVCVWERGSPGTHRERTYFVLLKRFLGSSRACSSLASRVGDWSGEKRKKNVRTMSAEYRPCFVGCRTDIEKGGRECTEHPSSFFTPRGEKPRPSPVPASDGRRRSVRAVGASKKYPEKIFRRGSLLHLYEFVPIKCVISYE